jgi:transposase-like protein
MDFPIDDLLDEDACYHRLLTWFHPDGLSCPDCHRDDRLGIHRRHREPVVDYRCGQCGRVFNAFTGTALQGTHYRPSTILLILRGIAQGVPTAQLARALNCDRGHLLALRHRLQDRAFRGRDRRPLDDPVVEADELDQNAGEKGVPTSIRWIRPGGGPTRCQATGVGTPIGRRSAGWWVGRAASSAWGSNTTRTGRRCAPACGARPGRGRRWIPTNGRATAAWRRWAGGT